METTDLRNRCKDAYERSRLELGLRAAWPVLPIAALSMLLTHRPAVTLAVSALLVVVAVSFRARGLAYGRALVPGFIAGAAPLVLPIILRSSGHCCIGQACWQVCMLGCIGGGLVAGISLGMATASQTEDRGAFLLSATAVAGLVGMLGCAISGVSGVIGMVLAMLITSLPVTLVAKARA
ncbi:MAG TPA: hypothetical protein VMF89_36415 [Polyangiales bacterium]|nr:hypothetical protein [Polyangiales bacterium]